MARLCINGRFLTQDLTGVQRYAREVLLGLDHALADPEPLDAGLSAELLLPPDAPECLALRRVRTRRVGRRTGHAWEQIDLPRAARGAVLFCPANTAPLLALLGAPKTVVTLHCLSFLERPESYTWGFRAGYRLLTASICRAADAVITVSHTERDRIAHRFPRASGRLHVVENGAAPAGFFGERDETPDPTRHYALYVGSFTPLKNLQNLLRALEIVNRTSPLDLVVVGDSMPGLRGAGLRVPDALRGRVRFAGQVNDAARLGLLYRRARCLVVPSRYESSGLPPLEAMVCGCPVVASRLPALVERCADAALYADPESPDDLAHQISLAVEDSSLRRLLIERGHKRAEHFDWRRTARETLAVLRDVANGVG